MVVDTFVLDASSFVLSSNVVVDDDNGVDVGVAEDLPVVVAVTSLVLLLVVVKMALVLLLLLLLVVAVMSLVLL